MNARSASLNAPVVSTAKAGLFTKLVPLQRLEFTQRLVDAEGNVIDPARAGLPPDFPSEVRTAVAFRRIRGNMTELTVTEYDWSAGQTYVYSLAGLHQSIDKLADHLRWQASIEEGTVV